MEKSFHHLIMKTYFAFHRSVMGEAKKLGLTSGQPKILEFLLEHDDVEQKDIATNCEIERATAGSILDRMEIAGLIERRRKAGNRRSVYVYLTESGRTAALQVKKLFAEAERRALAGLSEAEAQKLRGELEEIYKNICNSEE